MRWMILACVNFLVAILLVSVLIVSQTETNFSISESTFDHVKLDSTHEQFEASFGVPHLKFRNKWIYKGNQSATLIVYWKNQKATQVSIHFPHYVDFKDVSHVEGNGLTPLETSKDLVHSGWMKVGVPDKGLVFQINRDGLVREMTWHRPWNSEKSGGDILTILSLLRNLPPYAYTN